MQGAPHSSPEVIHIHLLTYTSSQRLQCKRQLIMPEQVSRRMLRVALEDPLNQRFLLVSEVCVPLYPPTVMYAQLMGEDKSRLNACAKEGWHTQSERSAPAAMPCDLKGVSGLDWSYIELVSLPECLSKGGLV